MRILAAFIIKEFRQLFRDRFMLKFLLVAPVFQLLLLGFSLTMETKHVKLLVCNLDGGQAGRDLVGSLSHNDRFDIVGETRDPRELEHAIRNRKARVGLYIPPGFSRKQAVDGTSGVLVMLDAVDGNAALTAFGYLVRAGSASGPEVRFWFNPELRNEAWMVPGIVVLIITIVTLLLGALSLVREKERGTLEQLAVTPIRKYQLFAGKLLPFFIYAFAELVIVLKLAEIVFRLKPEGSLLSLWLAVALYLFTTLGLGLLVSTVSRTQQQALFLAWFFMIFLILLSGFFIPVANMPWWLRQLTRLNPLRYMMTIVRDIWLKGSTPLDLWDQYLTLAGLGTGLLLASIVVWNKKAGP
jgi:ABC-2 type transport system permease protein